jgi:hypothetical protein
MRMHSLLLGPTSALPLLCTPCTRPLRAPPPQPYSVARMQRLVGLALAICNAVYMTVTICSGLVFGAALAPDVLSNVTTAAMAPLIGPRAAAAASACVRLGYLLSLIGSFVLLCYPLRQVRQAGAGCRVPGAVCCMLCAVCGQVCREGSAVTVPGDGGAVQLRH